jgi:predicted NBD/HSP70 family sugar kinase
MSMGDNAVLGVSMGTSQAGGYVTPAGNITPWLNELAFAPVDYRPDAPRDEWSGDIGCGVQYFSQQGVGRLAKKAGFDFPATLALPEQLIAVQDAMKAGDPRARAIYETIGVCFGYAVAHYADFYDVRNLLVLGRVTSGEGGEIILERRRCCARSFRNWRRRFGYAPRTNRINATVRRRRRRVCRRWARRAEVGGSSFTTATGRALLSPAFLPV